MVDELIKRKVEKWVFLFFSLPDSNSNSCVQKMEQMARAFPSIKKQVFARNIKTWQSTVCTGQIQSFVNVTNVKHA